jgi:predicted HNH restriction endonuclease
LEDAPSLTRIDDLAVVCANCHALIHVDLSKCMSIDTLRSRWTVERKANR